MTCDLPSWSINDVSCVIRGGKLSSWKHNGKDTGATNQWFSRSLPMIFEINDFLDRLPVCFQQWEIKHCSLRLEVESWTYFVNDWTVVSLSLKWTFRCFHPQHKQMNWSVVKEYHPVSLSLPSPCWTFWESKPTIQTVDNFIYRFWYVFSNTTESIFPCLQT